MVVLQRCGAARSCLCLCDDRASAINMISFLSAAAAALPSSMLVGQHHPWKRRVPPALLQCSFLLPWLFVLSVRRRGGVNTFAVWKWWTMGNCRDDVIAARLSTTCARVYVVRTPPLRARARLNWRISWIACVVCVVDPAASETGPSWAYYWTRVYT